MKHLLKSAVLHLLGSIVFMTAGFAQTGSATVSGRVFDPNAASIVEATVEARNVDTGVSSIVKTNTIGGYNLVGLSPGRYEILVSKNGFKQIVKSGLDFHTADQLSLNFTMDVGSAKETVTVRADAEQLPTDNPAVGLLVNRTFVENMPLNGRSFQDLISLAPGTVSTTSGLFAINGQRTDSNYYTVDGVAANVDSGNGFSQGLSGTQPASTVLGTTQGLISVDALQEFKIQTSGYSPEYGRQPGGQIQLMSRSGTNEFHGTLFDYFRNEALDANDWFFNQNSIPKAAERQNDFGGTFGGPLKFPHLYNGRDKTFLFVSYEGLRLRTPTFSGVYDVPTPEFRKFAAPGVEPFLNSIPLPNGLPNGDQCALPLNPAYTFSCTAQWSAGYSNPSKIDSVSARIDQSLGERIQIFLRFSETRSSQSSQYIPADNGTLSDNTVMWTIGSTARISSESLNELRFNYTGNADKTSVAPIAFDGAVPYPKDLVLPAPYLPLDSPGLNIVTIQLPSAESFSIPSYHGSESEQHQFNLIDSISWSRGSQAAKFGADYRRLSPLLNPFEYYTELDLFSINSVQRGIADNVSTGAFQKAKPVIHNLSLYAQDHWKVSPRLTFDFGLRWELNPTPGAADGLYPLALTSSNLAIAQLAPKGTPQYHTSYDNFAPRLGFAYEVLKSTVHQLVVRGGAGIFYDTGQAISIAGYQGYPFSAFQSTANVPLPATVSSLAPPSLSVPLTPPYGYLAGISDPNLKLPYTEQWNLSIDQSLNDKNVLTASYVGNAGRKLLLQEFYPNLANINPAFTSLYLNSASASSSYNALQVQDQGNAGSRAQIIAAYTWAHSIDDVSVDAGGNAPLRGNSDNDVRQVFNLAVNYALPGAPSQLRLSRALTTGWQVTGRFSAQSGYPVDVIQGNFPLPNGVQQVIRPDLVPGEKIYLQDVPNVLGGWALNPAAFAAVPTDPSTGAPLREGDLGRNYIHGPNFWNLNLSVQRNFTLHDKLQLAFRIEAFNIFNHPNAGNVDSFLADSTFGHSNPNGVGGVPTIGVPNQLYGTGAARSIQLALKLIF